MELKRVLIIDDEVDFLTIAKLNLEATGLYQVMTLSNATDIISYVHSFNPNIILLDVLMPKMTGIEACELLNKDEKAANIPIIMLSALDKDMDKLRAFKVGVVDYMVKPVDAKTLMAKIEKALQFRK